MYKNKADYNAFMNQYMREYRKTKQGLVLKQHRTIYDRVNGRWTNERSLITYFGLSLIPLQEFKEWAFSDPEFDRLFKNYVSSGYKSALKPTVSRLDLELGYEIDNMIWVTVREALISGNHSKHRR